jgi:hypothetical protein
MRRTKSCYNLSTADRTFPIRINQCCCCGLCCSAELFRVCCGAAVFGVRYSGVLCRVVLSCVSFVFCNIAMSLLVARRGVESMLLCLECGEGLLCLLYGAGTLCLECVHWCVECGAMLVSDVWGSDAVPGVWCCAVKFRVW